MHFSTVPHKEQQATASSLLCTRKRNFYGEPMFNIPIYKADSSQQIQYSFFPL